MRLRRRCTGRSACDGDPNGSNRRTRHTSGRSLTGARLRVDPQPQRRGRCFAELTPITGTVFAITGTVFAITGTVFAITGTVLFVCPPVFGTDSHRCRMSIGFGPIIRTPLRSCLRHCPSANALQPFVALRQRDVAVVALRRRVAAVAALLRCEVAECVSVASSQ